MDKILIGVPPVDGADPDVQEYQPVSGTYIGQHGLHRLELRVDLDSPQDLYRSLNLVSGDFYQDTGGGQWEYRESFLVEHPFVSKQEHEVTIRGTITYLGKRLSSMRSRLDTRPFLRVTIPRATIHEPVLPATVHVTHWGSRRLTMVCEKTSAFMRTIDLEIDRITGTELPRLYQTHSLQERPHDLPSLNLDIPRSYRRAGIDMRLISDREVFAPTEAGADLKWDEDELHNAMEHHFSEWRDRPQWKLYLLVAPHFRLYPDRRVTGIMYDSHYRDPHDSFPRQGVAAFYDTMRTIWQDMSPAEFDRNYLRTCVHELGHALNLLHPFDIDRPDSPSWMNYPWRYPYGYGMPSRWDGTQEFWKDCSFDFDLEELCHLRHDSLMEVIPGGAAFGHSSYDESAPMATSPREQEAAPVALYIRTRPERYLYHFAEPVSVELKLKNQMQVPMTVPDMLAPEYGLAKLYIRDPRSHVRTYRPLFRLCGDTRTTDLPPGEKLFESVFVAYGADGFYFEEPGEYQIWAVYGAGGLRVSSNVLRIRVAFPQTDDEEEMALWTFGWDQGHVLYMRGANHLRAGNEQLGQVTERFPKTNLSRYIHYCFGRSQARAFKDVARGTVDKPCIEDAIQQLEKARTFSPRWEKHSSLDNITHGRAVNLLADLYSQTDQPEQARSVLLQTAQYFTQMEVKPEVVDNLRQRAGAVRL